MDNNPPPELNPYAPPTTDPGLPLDSVGDARTLRKPLLSHEASIKGIGALFILGGLVFTGLFITGIVNPSAIDGAEDTVFLIVAAVIGIGELLTGWYLRKFKSWARGVATVLCAFSLLNFPLGTLLGAYFLYVLRGTKGSTVFSDRYQEAMRLTPDLKYRSPLWMRILLVVLVLLFIGLAIAGSMGLLE